MQKGQMKEVLKKEARSGPGPERTDVFDKGKREDTCDKEYGGRKGRKENELGEGLDSLCGRRSREKWEE